MYDRSFGILDAVAKLRLACLVLLLSLVAPGVAPAQSAFTFTSVTVEGNQRVEPATILKYASIPRGQAISAGQLNDAYQRLINSGQFEAVDLVPQGSRLVIRVTEYPIVDRVSIEGNRRLKDEDLIKVVKSQPPRLYSPSQAEEDAAAIVAEYQRAGRLAASVTPKIIRRNDGRVDLVFEVAEGRVTEIERISFNGNRAFSDGRLRRVLGSKQAGILHSFIQRDQYDERNIAFDRQVLRDFYLSRGYVDFQVLSVSQEFARERNAYFLNFNLVEGQQFKFGKITTVSEVEGVDATPYEPLARIRTGTVYTPTVVDLAITRMENLALRQGLDFIRVDPRVTRHDADGTLDIAFTIVRGPRIFVERIDIEGNNTTLDRVIRTQFRTVEGDPFNPREIRQASERIRALGFFSSSEVQPRQGSSSDQVIVDVNVEEQPTGSLAFGASYGADSGFGLSASFAESNFLGRGQALRFEFGATDGSRSYIFDFTEPNLLGRDVRGRLNLRYRETDNYNSDYDTATGTIAPTIDFPVSEYGRVALSYRIGYSEVRNVDDGSSIILKQEEDQGGGWNSGVGLSYTYDTRRYGLDPNRGFLFTIDSNIAGLGGDDKFVKTVARLEGQRKVLNEQVTLTAALEGGAFQRIGGDDGLIVDRFLLGSSTLRGFAYGGIGPRDLAVANEDALGGNYYAVARFEAQFPLGLPEEYGIDGGVFLDVGTLWGLDNRNGGPTGTDPVDDSAHIRAALGFSIFWTTPLGPLRFNFSTPLQKESYDETQGFDLTISTRF